MAPKKRELLLLERRGSEKRLRVTVPVAAAAAVAAVGVGTAALASPATRMLRKIVLVLLFLLRMCVPAASIHRVLANPHPIPSHLSNFYFFCFVLCVCVCRSERVTVVESISQIGRMVSKWINGSMILPPCKKLYSRFVLCKSANLYLSSSNDFSPFPFAYTCLI